MKRIQGPHKITSPHGLNAYIKSVCDIMRRSGRAGALQYVPELTWMLFLRILDEKEEREAGQMSESGIGFTPSLEYPYRWRDWAVTHDRRRSKESEGRMALMSFVNGKLIPYLKGLKNESGVTPRQKIIGEIFSFIERTGIDTESNLLDVLEKINELSMDRVDETHMFTISQVYEGLLQRMGEKNSDGGQFFTPRGIVRVMVRVIDPQIGETVYDPCCGTGGFLVQAYMHMKERAKTLNAIKTLKTRTFFGREKESLIYPIALANLLLHGVDEPHIWHGNTLTGLEYHGGLFQGAPALFDVILTNPPFGGKEGKEAQSRFPYKTSSTQMLFLQHVMDSLRPGGRCGIVLDEGVLFRTNESAFVEIKRRLLSECDLWCIVSLPTRVFVNAGTGSKTNLLFFTKGEPTKKVWYYDLSDLSVTKRQPLTLAHFDGFFRLLPKRGISKRSWYVSIDEIKERGYDLKAVNPNRKDGEDKWTPEELISIIESQSDEIARILRVLKEYMNRET